jgi:antitoxin component YwqK of YwqJK toxin-antitoxin module
LETTRTAAYSDNGQLSEAIYFVGDREVAREIYTFEGILSYRNGWIPDGRVVEYYVSGQTKKEWDYTDNKASGESLSYYISGEIKERNSFDHGLLHGCCRMYRRDGRLWREVEYRKGILYGPSRSFHDNGEVETTAIYINGQLHGCFRKYDRCGFLVEQSVFNKGRQRKIFGICRETDQIHGTKVHTETSICFGGDWKDDTEREQTESVR